MDLQEVVHAVRSRDGVTLRMTEVFVGSGPRSHSAVPFLLVHGFMQNRHAFLLGDLPRTLLDRGARVFIAELRGHGRSLDPSRLENTTRLETHLDEDLPAFLDFIQGLVRQKTVHIVAHSMGGFLGYALLGRTTALASLTTLGAPIFLAKGRPHLRASAVVLGTAAALWPPERLPLDRALLSLSHLLARPEASPLLRVFQRLTGLANPAQVAPERLQAALEAADPAITRVFIQLARMAMGGRAQIGGVDLCRAVRMSPIPIAFVVGSRDLFGGRLGVQGALGPGHRGPRTLVEIEGGAHVDLTVGPQVASRVEALWPFLVSA